MPQKRNAQQVDLLATDFQRKHEPGFSMARLISTHLALPELRGLWIGDTQDRSTALNHLTAPNSFTAGVVTVLPYCALASASSQYFSWIGDREALIFSYSGTQVVATGALRVENPFKSDRRLLEVRLRVSTAPTGAALIVDVLLNGVSLFAAPADRPQIAAAATSGSAPVNGTRTWQDAQYITVDIVQVGSTIAGSDLIVELVYS